MSDRRSGITFTIFRWTLVLVIFAESSITVFHSLASTTESRLGSIIPWIAGLEALAGLMLLVRRTTMVGGTLLLAIFIFALIVHGPAERSYLFVYAASVIFLMADGVHNSA